VCFVIRNVFIYIFTTINLKTYILKAQFIIKPLKKHFSINLDVLQINLFNSNKKIDLVNRLKKDIKMQFNLHKNIKLSNNDIKILTINK